MIGSVRQVATGYLIFMHLVLCNLDAWCDEPDVQHMLMLVQGQLLALFHVSFQVNIHCSCLVADMGLVLDRFEYCHSHSIIAYDRISRYLGQALLLKPINPHRASFGSS